MLTLPIEIVENIASYVQHEDSYNCMIVNKTWYPVFARVYYREIKVNSRHQLLALFNALTAYSKVIRARAYIRKLDISNMPCYIRRRRFHGLMNFCPYIELILMPDNPTWLDFLLDAEVPKMESLSEIQFPKFFRNLSETRILECYYRHRSTLKKISVDVRHLPEQTANPVSYIRSFPQLTYLYINVSIDNPARDLFDDIIHTCPHLKTLVYVTDSLNRLAENTYPDDQHESLTDMKLEVNEIAEEDIYYIKGKFPHLRNLSVSYTESSDREVDTMNAFMTLNHLENLAVSVSLEDFTHYETCMYAFWRHADPILHPQAKDAKKTMTFSGPFHSYIPFRFSVTKSPVAGIKSMSADISLIILVHKPLELYLQEFGCHLTDLIFDRQFGADISMNLINTLCPLLTALNLPISILRHLMESFDPNENITELTVSKFPIKLPTMKMIELCFPKLKVLKLVECEIDDDFILLLKHTSHHVCLQLPETNLESLYIQLDPLIYSAIPIMIDRMANERVACRWYYCPQTQKTIQIHDDSIDETESTTSSMLHLKSSTLKFTSLNYK
ncbi:hypothetical protein BDB01DRAFT_458551 [Pilobolus umbonatus]|nr:hypothetical protein BDB01DRAFT_458551 [Pilobolus umbonatus]